MPDMNENGVALKKIKDFNDEEKAAILARANKIELPRVAKEFGTTWQVVSAIQRAAKAGKKAKVSPKKKNVSAKKSKAVKASPSNDERRLAILQRASEIGITQAAAEAGVSKWTVFQWRKVMKKAGYDIPAAARIRRKSKAVETEAAAKPAKAKKSGAKLEGKALKAKETPITISPKKSGSYSQLELENEMLKQQIATLSTQIEKLRAALSQLA